MYCRRKSIMISPVSFSSTRVTPPDSRKATKMNLETLNSSSDLKCPGWAQEKSHLYILQESWWATVSSFGLGLGLRS